MLRGIGLLSRQVSEWVPKGYLRRSEGQVCWPSRKSMSIDGAVSLLTEARMSAHWRLMDVVEIVNVYVIAMLCACDGALVFGGSARQNGEKATAGFEARRFAAGWPLAAGPVFLRPACGRRWP